MAMATATIPCAKFDLKILLLMTILLSALKVTGEGDRLPPLPLHRALDLSLRRAVAPAAP
jgi:hypothetical protein